MKILLLAASEAEIAPTLAYLEKEWEKKSFLEYTKEGTSVFPLISGNGSFFAGLALSRFPSIDKIDYVVNPGLGAGVSRTLDLGKTYLITEECFGDIGLEEGDGSFKDLHDMTWYDKNKFPFLKGKLFPKTLLNPTFLPKCSSITVNKIPGTTPNIENFIKKYHQDMMTLDGAGTMYTCRILDIDLIQYRVVSRYVEPYQIKFQKLSEYIGNLHIRTRDILESLNQQGIY